MSATNRLVIVIAVIILLVCVALYKARAQVPENLRLDIVQVDDNLNPVGQPISMPIVTFNVTTPVLTVKIRQNTIFANGFDN